MEKNVDSRKVGGKQHSKVAAGTRPKRKRVEFMIDAGVGKTVAVAGTFNDWNTESKILVDRNHDGVYYGYLMLPSGEYEYKFVVDGVWCVDDNNSDITSNDFGTLNNKLKVEI